MNEPLRIEMTSRSLIGPAAISAASSSLRLAIISAVNSGSMLLPRMTCMLGLRSIDSRSPNTGCSHMLGNNRHFGRFSTGKLEAAGEGNGDAGADPVDRQHDRADDIPVCALDKGQPRRGDDLAR